VTAWVATRLGEVLNRAAMRIVLEPNTSYREVTVRMNGKGVVERRIVRGAEVASDKRFLVKAGQFIISRIDARNGASGLVPPDLDGAIVTNDFPVFDIVGDRLDSRFFSWMSRTLSFVELCKRASEGTTNRVRLDEKRFSKLSIQIPPLGEQQRIVARIEMIAGKIQQARDLRRQAATECDGLLRSILFGDKSAVAVPMAELVRQRSADVTVQASETYRFAGVYSFGRGVFRGLERQGMEFAYPRLSRLRAGDFIYPKLMAWEGALGVVPEECDGLVVSTEFPVFEVDRARVLPEVLDIYFRTPSVWPKLSGASTGTNVRRRRLNPADFLRYRMPLPSAAIQDRLRDAKQRIDSVKRLHAETAKELDAMLPAVLDRGFRGEL
jgi:type I restriction enzyme S subunit